MHVYHYAAYEKTALRKLSVMQSPAKTQSTGGCARGFWWISTRPCGTASGSPRIRTASRNLSRCIRGKSAFRGRERRRRLGGCLCPLLRCARRRPVRRSGHNPRRDLRLQRIRLPLHAGAAELAPGPGRERGIKPGGDAAHAAAASTAVGAGADSGPASAELDPLEVALAELAGPGVGLSEDDRKAVSMLAAAVSYHRRERKAFWWAHFDRCENGPDTHHQQDRNVFLVEDAEVLEDWWKDGAKLPERRVKTDRHGQPGLGPP